MKHPIVDQLDTKRTAAEHASADEACGREWTCQCGACRQVRAGKCTCMRGLRPDRWHRSDCAWYAEGVG